MKFYAQLLILWRSPKFKYIFPEDREMLQVVGSIFSSHKNLFSSLPVAQKFDKVVFKYMILKSFPFQVGKTELPFLITFDSFF